MLATTVIAATDTATGGPDHLTFAQIGPTAGEQR